MSTRNYARTLPPPGWALSPTAGWRSSAPLVGGGPGTVAFMDETEAKAVAASVLEEWRPVPFAQLVELVEHSLWVNRVGSHGGQYAVKVYGLWDAGVTGGDLRVVAAAMDGTKTRLRNLRSVSDDFIVTPTGHVLE